MIEKSLEAIAESEPCVVDHCGDFAVDMHHRKQKSAGGSDRRANLVYICRRHHSWVHDHLSYAHDLGLIVWDHEDEPNEILRRVRTRPVRQKPKRPFSAEVEHELSTILDLNDAPATTLPDEPF